MYKPPYPSPLSPFLRFSGVIQLTLALHFLHERGFLHRDLKPINILVFNGEDPTLPIFGEPKLDKHGLPRADATVFQIADLGCAKRVRHERTDVRNDGDVGTRL